MVKMRHQRNATVKGSVKKRWVDLVDPVLALYNQSPHTSLDGHSPHFASRPENWREIFDTQQEGFSKRKRKHRKNYYRRGTRVRIRLKGGSFGLRASDKKNSDEVFRVRQVHSSMSTFLSLLQIICASLQLVQWRIRFAMMREILWRIVFITSSLWRSVQENSPYELSVIQVQ